MPRQSIVTARVKREEVGWVGRRGIIALGHLGGGRGGRGGSGGRDSIRKGGREVGGRCL